VSAPEQRPLPGINRKRRARKDAKTTEAMHGGTLIAAADVLPGDLIVLAHRPRPVAAVDRHATPGGADRVTLHATGRTFTLGARERVERCGRRWEVAG